MKKLLFGLGAGLVLALGAAGPAGAHVTPTPSEAPAGGFAAITFRVGHGCEGQGGDTEKVEIQMPEGVESATPQAIAGWESGVDEGADGLVVTFEGGPLPHDQYLEFGVSLQLPDTPGETAMFPVVQTCVSGEEIAWTEETVEGEEEPESPAPVVAITEATGDSHGGEAPEAEGTEVAAGADTEASEDGGSDTLATVALVVGVLGLLAGAYAIATARRAS